MRDQLLGFLTWQLDQKVATIPVVRRHGRLLADLPYRTDRELKIPTRVYRPYWRDLDPYVEVESVTWQRGNLVIAGLAYVPSIDISKRRYTNKIVILRPRRKFRPPIVSLASSWRHPRATQISGQERYDYAWAGFRVRDLLPLVPGRRAVADRGLGLLHPGPRPRRVAAGPAAQPGSRRRGPPRGARAGAGRAGPPHLGGPPAARGGAAHAGPAGLVRPQRRRSRARGGPRPGRGRGRDPGGGRARTGPAGRPDRAGIRRRDA